MCNDVACQIMGIGSVKLRLHDGQVRELTDGRYVPDLKRNLISLGTLNQNGCSIRIDGGILRVLRDSMVVMRGEKRKGVYVLKGEVVSGSTLFSVDDESMQTKL